MHSAHNKRNKNRTARMNCTAFRCLCVFFVRIHLPTSPQWSLPFCLLIFFIIFHFLLSLVQVKAMRNFDINEMMGFWYVVQYYASSEEAAEYSCMKCNFSMSDESALVRFQFLIFFFWQFVYEREKGKE